MWFMIICTDSNNFTILSANVPSKDNCLPLNKNLLIKYQLAVLLHFLLFLTLNTVLLYFLEADKFVTAVQKTMIAEFMACYWLVLLVMSILKYYKGNKLQLRYPFISCIVECHVLRCL